jgi:hypothetical protein
MKRLLIALCILLPAGAALAFDPAPAPVSIGILSAPDTFRYDEAVYRAVRESLRDELKARGVDAFLADADFDRISRDEARSADYYVEIVGDTRTDDYGGVGVSGRHADVGLGVLVSRMAADVYIYEGRTLELVGSESLAKRNTAVLPTGVGIGDHNLFAWIATPFVERAQMRRVARAVGVDMAGRVVAVVRSR